MLYRLVAVYHSASSDAIAVWLTIDKTVYSTLLPELLLLVF